MKIRRTIVAAVSGLALAGGAVALPSAQATEAHFTIGGTGLAVSEPAPAGGVDLGTVAAGSLAHSGNLGEVTVTDGRGALVAAWTATVTSTDFVRQGAGATPAANEVVPKANISYVSGVATDSSGVGAFVPGVSLTMDLPAALRIAGTWAGTGTNSASWDPTLAFTLLGSQVAGTYAGTVTHSVA